MGWYIDAFKNYVNFSGRASRTAFWMFVLIHIIVSVILVFVDGAIGAMDQETGMGLLSFVYSLAVLIPGIALGVRRLHDSGKTGWLYLLVFVPVIGGLVLLVFFVLPSEPGDNQYGSAPA
jgi:uncharacterized membrane protein YhaH (DUF805 family)